MTYRDILPIPLDDGIQLTLFGKVTVRTRRGERPAKIKGDYRMSVQSVDLTQEETTTPTPTPKCPYCEADLIIGYTEHGTKAWDGKAWLETDKGEDAQYYCLACYADLDYEDLEKLDVF